MRSARNNRNAFTLIEVLVAMALIAIILPVAMKGVSLVSASTQVARARTEATMLAETKLHELISEGLWNDAIQSGDFGNDWSNYRWIAQASPRDTDLVEMKIQVYWQFRNQEQSLALTTLVYTGGTTQ